MSGRDAPLHRAATIMPVPVSARSRVEHLWPAAPDRLHVLAGNARLSRGMVLELSGGQPERYLRGG